MHCPGREACSAAPSVALLASHGCADSVGTAPVFKKDSDAQLRHLSGRYILDTASNQRQPNIRNAHFC